MIAPISGMHSTKTFFLEAWPKQREQPNIIEQ